jgi:lauroyl/myristoyl acyltransferase
VLEDNVEPALLSPGDLVFPLYPVVPRSWLYAVARLRGLLHWALRTGDRRAVEGNIREFFGRELPPAEIARLTRRFFQNQQLQNLLATLVTRLSTGELERLAPFEGLEHFEAALASRRGVVLLGSHLNSAVMFLVLAQLRRRGYDVGVAMPVRRDPWRETRFRKWIDRLTRQRGLREEIGTFYAQFNIRPIVERMRGGGAIAMTGDGWHAAAFVEQDFLGRRLPFPTGAMGVARATGAMVVPVFEVGQPPDKLRVVFEPAFEVSRDGNPRADLERAVGRYVKSLERHVRANIAGWQHLLVPNMAATLETWPRRPLAERYRL